MECQVFSAMDRIGGVVTHQTSCPRRNVTPYMRYQFCEDSDFVSKAWSHTHTHCT